MLFTRLRSSAPSSLNRSRRGGGDRHLRSLYHLSLGLLAGGLAIAIAPAQAADYLYVNFGLLERSISIRSLGIYARSGQIEGDLRGYAQYASAEQLADLREVLQTPVEVSPAALSQFLYSAPGSVLLSRLGEVIRTENRKSGSKAIRAALVLAAADEPTGLTPLNLLEKFPLQGIRIDLNRALQIFNSIEQVINQTQQIICGVEQRSNQEAQVEQPSSPEAQTVVPPSPAPLTDLRRSGPYTAVQQFITVTRPSAIPERGSRSNVLTRRIPTTLYLPEIAGRTAPVPLVVISHGLGSNRRTFAYLAEHLASYGFAVAVPEHPNSNTEWLNGVIDGASGQDLKPEELIERPLDITALLNRLERDRPGSSTSRIDTQTVGVIGQSLGGYTALALAGAPINLPQLKQDCNAENALDNTLNVSLVLQCSFLEKNLPLPELRDRRVKAVFAINPLGSSLFGETGFAAIDIPVLLGASGADTVTPALIEQFTPFTWLTTPNRYLMLMQNATHFSAIDITSADRGAIDLPREVIGPDPAIARRYIDAMSVAFLGTYLNLDQQFSEQTYLNATYVERVLNNQSPNLLPINFVSAHSSALLNASDNPECGL